MSGHSSRATAWLRPIALCCGLALVVSCSKDKEKVGNQEEVVRPDSPRAIDVDWTPPLPASYDTAHWPKPTAPATDPWERKYLQATTDDERIQVIGEKESAGPESLAPILRRALQEPSEPVQLQAIDSARMLSGDDAIDILSGAASQAKSEDIALLALDVASYVPVEARMAVYESTLVSPHESVREMTSVLLSRERTKPAIDLLVLGLADQAESVRASARQSFRRLFEQDFDSAGTAHQWWTENSNRYNDQLILVQP